MDWYDVKNLSPGDRIRIVDEFDDKCLASVDHEMDKWLGKILTVDEVLHDENIPNEFSYCVRCNETNSDNPYQTWYWYPAAIAGLVTNNVELPSMDNESLLNLYD